MDFSRSRATKTSNIRRNSRSDIAKLLAKSIAGKSCPICFCLVEDRRAAVIIPCMHAYCVDCIGRWSRMKQKCPLCNGEFDSWFTKINLASQTFRRDKLPIKDKTVTSHGVSFRRRGRLVADELRLIRRYGEELNPSSSSRTRPLPWRRSFMNRNEHPGDIAERVMRWRATIYENRLQAVPIVSRSCPLQKPMRCIDANSAVLQRIEPWIRRELHAILGDPDPSVIVHVVTALFLSAYAEMCENFSVQRELEPDFLGPLEPFLHVRTKMFWHELRCFAESSLSMATYDCVVEYTRLSG